MIQILISFNLRPGVETEYGAFVVEKGVPFWHTQKGIVAVRGYRNVLWQRAANRLRGGL